MEIKNKNLDKVRKNPRIFAEILARLNSGSVQVQPFTLTRRLQRYSEIVKTNSVIADYFREVGYKEEEIFETKKPLSAKTAVKR